MVEELELARSIPLCLPMVNKFGTCCALLIQQVHFWTTVSPNRQEGFGWCYNTCEAWAKQLDDTYNAEVIRKQFRVLERMGIVVSGNFNRTKYDRTKWYRLDYVKLLECMGGGWYLVPTGQKIGIQLARKKEPIPEMMTEKMTESTSGYAKPAPGKIQVKKADEEQKEKKKEDNMGKTAKEILDEKMQAKIDKSPVRLEILWKDKMAELKGGKFQWPLTLKNLGQLKMIKQKAGAIVEPLPFVVWVMDHWWTFAMEVRAKAGLKNVPTQPDVGFLLVHCDIGVDLFLQSIAESSQVCNTDQTNFVEGVASKDETASSQGKVIEYPVEEVYKPSAEEIQATLASLKE